MPKDGTVHELTSNVRAARDPGGLGRPHQNLEVLSTLSRPGLPSKPEPKVGSEFAATVFTRQPRALDVPCHTGCAVGGTWPLVLP